MASSAAGLSERGMRVLLVDGDAHARDHLRELLEREGYDVLEATDGREALDCFRAETVDLVVLELALDGISGFQVCRAIRAVSDVALVVVTVLRDEVDMVVAFEIGADDYVCKPFLDRELALRFKAVIRRSGRARPSRSATGPQAPTRLQLDSELQCVSVDGRQVALSSREFLLLELLLRSDGHVLTRERILTAIWGHQVDADGRMLDAQVRRLRRKIEIDPGVPSLLITVRGRGFRLTV